jgi:hypothetical protein
MISATLSTGNLCEVYRKWQSLFSYHPFSVFQTSFLASVAVVTVLFISIIH